MDQNKISIRVHKHRQQLASDDYEKLIFISEFQQRQPSDVVRRLIRKEYDTIKNETLSGNRFTQE